MSTTLVFWLVFTSVIVFALAGVPRRAQPWLIVAMLAIVLTFTG